MSFILTVYFEDPFWVGVFTLSEGNAAQYSRVVFGQEPSDIEVYEYFQKNANVLRFTDSYPEITRETIIKNPKRRQREISKELHNRVGPKKSLEAIKQLEQQNKKEKQQEGKRAKKAELEAYLFSLKQEKAREKHRGH
jgi:hypothetical protein